MFFSLAQFRFSYAVTHDCNFAIGNESIIKDVIETNSDFVAALDEPTSTETLVIILNEVPDTPVPVPGTPLGKRQASNTITIEVDVTQGKFLAVIPKEKLRNQLVKGTSYEMQVSWSMHACCKCIVIRLFNVHIILDSGISRETSFYI